MVVHREKKEMQIYELVVAKGGPKLKRSAEATPAAEDAPKDALKGDISKEDFLGKDGYPALSDGVTMAMGYGRGAEFYTRGRRWNGSRK